ncbi:DUF2272 domain-containing protein [Roseomonas gilardii subsp. gilardii]|uniref:DUF2272 domain-containing protein n=1 Tax=Roseomonas gilardii TaxID=257708 RepID=UPI001FFAF168|nr:DUF2272 domain-containing protein [Roseomonas gilardii]UPG71985.1 DUF2272 domain-containing protein [Roseomonas gilardii subsp. gilardii]
MRKLLILAILLLPTACATPPPTAAPPERLIPEVRDPGRAPLVHAAVREWEAWGKLVLTGWEPVLDGHAIPSPANFPRVLAYWEAVPGNRGVARQHQRLHDALMLAMAQDGQEPVEPAISLWAYPFWSAAFISYVMEQAGIGEADFTPSARHAAYIDGLLARASWDPEGAAFRPRAPEEYAPQPGDLLCADRSTGNQLLSWAERMAETGAFRPMHCDVVVSGQPGLVQAIGGNVRDAVVLRRLPADEKGRVKPAPYGEAGFFVVFENRLGQRGMARHEGRPAPASPDGLATLSAAAPSDGLMEDR